MFDSNTVFESPVTTVGQVIGSAFSIFKAQWKTLVAIAFGKMASIFLLFFLFGLALIAWVAPAFECFFTGEFHERNLADHFTGVPTGGYRHLYDGSFEVNDNKGTECLTTAFAQISSKALAFFGILLVFLVCTTLVSTVYDGTMIHALAHTYIGHFPSVSNSFRYALKRMCDILTFTALYISIVFISTFVCVGLPAVLSKDPNPVFIFLTFVAFAIFSFVFNTTMIAGIPSIVVEGQSAIAAFPRSYYLCKNSICFIFCSIFCFNLIVLITNLIINSLRFGQDGFFAVLLAIIQFAISVVFSILGVAITVILYISLRARSEQLTQPKMAEELGDCVATPVAYKYNGVAPMV